MLPAPSLLHSEPSLHLHLLPRITSSCSPNLPSYLTSVLPPTVILEETPPPLVTCLPSQAPNTSVAPCCPEFCDIRNFHVAHRTTSPHTTCSSSLSSRLGTLPFLTCSFLALSLQQQDLWTFWPSPSALFLHTPPQLELLP